MRKKFKLVIQWPKNEAFVMLITGNLWNPKLIILLVFFSLKLNLTSCHNNIASPFREGHLKKDRCCFFNHP